MLKLLGKTMKNDVNMSKYDDNDLIMRSIVDDLTVIFELMDVEDVVMRIMGFLYLELGIVWYLIVLAASV